MLLDVSDLVCITETWGEVQSEENWTIHNYCKERSNIRRVPGCGEVAMIHRSVVNFKARTFRCATKYEHVIIYGRPIVGCHVSPKATAEEFKLFLTDGGDLLRAPGIIIGDFNARARQWDDTANRRGRF